MRIELCSTLGVGAESDSVIARRLYTNTSIWVGHSHLYVHQFETQIHSNRGITECSIYRRIRVSSENSTMPLYCSFARAISLCSQPRRDVQYSLPRCSQTVAPNYSTTPSQQKAKHHLRPISYILPLPLFICHQLFPSPNNLPNNPPPPPAPLPAPPFPPLLASSRIHLLKNSRSFIFSTLVTFVPSCASCRLNANSVGIELIYPHPHTSAPSFPIPPFHPTHPSAPPHSATRKTNQYPQHQNPHKTKHTINRIPTPSPPVPPNDGASNSTSANPTPPSSSPTPSFSTSSRTTGPTTLHDGHHDAVQSVNSGRRFEAESRRRDVSSSSWRILWICGALAFAER